MKLGQQLKAQRKEHGISQDEQEEDKIKAK